MRKLDMIYENYSKKIFVYGTLHLATGGMQFMIVLQTIFDIKKKGKKRELKHNDE
jgi:hypothetical protein